MLQTESILKMGGTFPLSSGTVSFQVTPLIVSILLKRDRA